jgi:hypothetical protein
VLSFSVWTFWNCPWRLSLVHPVLTGKRFSLGLNVFKSRVVGLGQGSMIRLDTKVQALQRCVNRTNQLKNLKGNWFYLWRVSIGSKKNNIRPEESPEQSSKTYAPWIQHQKEKNRRCQVYIGKPPAISPLEHDWASCFSVLYEYFIWHRLSGWNHKVW